MAHASTPAAGEVQLDTFYFQDGDCDNVIEDITPTIEEMAMPGSGPSETLLFDFEGVICNLTITGKLTIATSDRTEGEASVKTIEEQKAFLKALPNGFQSAVTLKSTFNSSGIKVMIKKIHFNEKSGDPNELIFTINLVEGQG
ncbi:unnamed protein product [marine sediment metagenome]|uniref:Uncharacterized protein n=1 Tax=marine sediment metagenome TaxID=412755 RepID=X1J912_9ZZZZ